MHNNVIFPNEAQSNYTVTKEKDLEFLSHHDNLTIKYDLYIPLPKHTQADITQTQHDLQAHMPTIIQIAHGMVEHKERYEWLCTNLALCGYIVAIHDHRGHGKSIDNIHPWGEMGGIKSDNTSKQLDGFHKAIEDMYTFSHLLKTRFNIDRVVLLGHSMGSLLSRGYFKKYGNELCALILSGSPAYNPLLSFGIGLAKIFQLFGLHTKGKHIINNLSFGGFNKPFQKHDSEATHSTGPFAWLSRDKKNVQAYINDDACQFVFSLGSFIALFQGTLWVQNPIDSNSPFTKQDEEKPPIYIISGEHDSCGDFGKGVVKIAQKFQDHDFTVTLKLYPEARHEIFQEINKHEIVYDLLHWLHTI